MSASGSGQSEDDGDVSQSTIRGAEPPRQTPPAPSSEVIFSDDNAWATAQEHSSIRPSSSSAIEDSLSSSFISSNNSTINKTVNTKRLWAAVKTSAKLAAGNSGRRRRNEASAYDEEGMSSQQEDLSSRKRAGSGAHLDQWTSIAHLLDHDDDGNAGSLRRDNSSTARTVSASRSRQRRDRRSSEPGITDSKVTLTQEPESMLSDNLSSIPGQDDPLAYKSGTQLLDSDDEESDSDDDYDTCTENDEKNVDLRSRLISLIKRRPSLFVKTVIKCVLAYFIASLFTYSPYLSHRMALLLPDHDDTKEVPISNLHLIATVAVYFHPGRSMGSMIEASIYAAAAFLYSIFIGLASMLVAVVLHNRDMPILSNTITVTVFVGVAMALVGYAKVKIGRPNFNTACSLISVISFTVIVLEGSTHLGQFSTEKIWQVFLVVLVGVLISNIVCFAIWPTSACTSLQLDIRCNLESFSTLLKVLTKTFLLDDVKQFNVRSDRIKMAIDDHHASFISLKKNLFEARLEAPIDVRIRGRIASYVHVVDSLNVLAQHLGGLRSSCGLQHEIIMTQRARLKTIKRRASDLQVPMSSSDLFSLSESDFSLSGSKEMDERFVAFRQFLDSVGPHMRSLVFTCSRTLKSLTGAFAATKGRRAVEGKLDGESESFDGLRKDVSAALRRFQHEQTVATKRLYTIQSGIDASTLTSRTDEDINLIYYFVFLLEQFSRELQVLVEALEIIRIEEERIEEKRSESWWRHYINPQSHMMNVKRKSKSSFWTSVKGLFINSNPSINLPSTKAHQENTGQTPAVSTRRDQIYRYIWRLGEFLKQADTKFAIKAGLGSALLASPAFITKTRGTFTAYKGQWALVSFMVVLSPTVGQSNQMSIHRSLGTLLGASTAMFAYTLFPDNNVALPIFGALFSIPCFCWIIGKPQLASSGRFVLLTFNLTALYSYNLRKVGIEVEEIALHRTAAVIVGVVWATILNHLVWPYEARRELAKGLSDLLFKLGFLYQRVALSYSSKEEVEEEEMLLDEDEIEEQPLLQSTKSRKKDEIQSLELHLQVHLIKLEGLLNQTKHEPRLKGPFPIDTYKKFLGCCQGILDLLHTMNQVTSRGDWYTQVRKDFIIPIDGTGKRKQMVGSVMLFFWLLASAFHLKTPLPPFLPPAEMARLQVLQAIRELPVVKKRAIRGSSEYLLYFAYALSMKDLIHQLEEIGRLAQESFGVLGGSVGAFEEQFCIDVAIGEHPILSHV